MAEYRPWYPDKDEVDALLALKADTALSSDIEIGKYGKGVVLTTFTGRTGKLTIERDEGLFTIKIIEGEALPLTIYTANLVQTPYTYSTPTTLLGAIGERTVIIDGATITLPANPAEYTGQTINFVAVGASSNAINFNGNTVNEAAGPVSLLQYDSYTVHEYNGNWLGMNLLLTVP